MIDGLPILCGLPLASLLDVSKSYQRSVSNSNPELPLLGYRPMRDREGDAEIGHLSQDMRPCSCGIRRIILEQSKRANVGHIGSALSIADIVSVLYSGALHVSDRSDAERDRFVLSKGHAALAVYAALALAGRLGARDLDTYCADGTILGVHPDRALRGIDFSTGSLGLGLSIGAGAALAARMQGSKRRVFVLLSDAECDEGSTWEAVMFAAHHRLGNLVAIVDFNGQQALGRTADVLALTNLAERWRAFGWVAHDIDGHDAAALHDALAPSDAGRGPHVLVARTTFGKGVSYMEGRIKWHYWPMSDDDYWQALKEVRDSPCATHSSAR